MSHFKHVPFRHQREIPAFAAGFACVAFHARLGAFFGDGLGLVGRHPVELAEFGFDVLFEIFLQRRRLIAGAA